MRFARNLERLPLPSAGPSVSVMPNYRNEGTFTSRSPKGPDRQSSRLRCCVERVGITEALRLHAGMVLRIRASAGTEGTPAVIMAMAKLLAAE